MYIISCNTASGRLSLPHPFSCILTACYTLGINVYKTHCRILFIQSTKTSKINLRCWNSVLQFPEMYSETTFNYLIAFPDIKDPILAIQTVIEIARDREINSVVTILRADKQNDT